MLRTIILAAAFLALTTPARAQIVLDSHEPALKPYEISVALALNRFNDVNARPLCEELALPCASSKTFPDSGVAISFSRNFRRVFGFVVEGGHYRERWIAPEGHQPAAGPQVNKVYSLLFGPRVSIPVGQGGRTRVFGQVLIGARMSHAVEGSNALQSGFGADFETFSPMKVRFQIDYCRMQRNRYAPNVRTLDGPRALIGVVIPFGDPARNRRLPPRPRW